MKLVTILNDDKGYIDWPKIKKHLFEAMLEGYDFGAACKRKKDGRERINLAFFKRDTERRKLIKAFTLNNTVTFDVLKAISKPQIILEKTPN
jgi:hypothetical protein